MTDPTSEPTDAWQTARAELLTAEIELKEQRERVAEMRRSLPKGPAVEDYELQRYNADGSTSTVRLSELFEDGHDELIVIQFMYGGAQTNPCPMCTMWTDGYNAIAEHIRRRASFALVAETDVTQMAAWAKERGWSNLPLLSSGGTSFKTDFRMADDEGNQLPGVSVFTKDDDGTVRHFCTQCARMNDEHWRGMDLLSPVWNLFDLLPSGRGN